MLPSWSSRALLLHGFALGVLGLGACEDATASPGRAGAGVAPQAGSCSPQFATAACSCEGAPGRQVCLAGTWGACECESAQGSGAGSGSLLPGQGGAGAGAGQPGAGTLEDPEGNRHSHRFDWERTVSEAGSCEPGRYVGTFAGIYRSPAAWGFPLPVADSPKEDGTPGLEFWLEPAPGSGEFFSVTGGKLRGRASAAGNNYDFTGELSGTLDCKTRKYVGKIENGHYRAGGNDHHFVGDVTADYDKISHTFVNGEWLLTEPTSGVLFAGGEIAWSAMLSP